MDHFYRDQRDPHEIIAQLDQERYEKDYDERMYEKVGYDVDCEMRDRAANPQDYKDEEKKETPVLDRDFDDAEPGDEPL